MQRHIISILIIKGQFIDSLLRRKFSTQSLETRSHHLSILVAENSLINIFNLTILMWHCINMANFSVFLCASPRDIRIWQINSQNFRIKKIWKTWFLDMGAFSWHNATYTIQFILTIYTISEKLMLPERCALLNFSVETAENCEKQQKVATPLLVLYPETKYHTWNYKV